ncbi:MAG: PIG-L deacetylase family protein, partial [Actinomycetota bacterium]
MPEDAAEPTLRTGPVLGIYAHPDDAEISAGGTMAKWVAAGREVHLLVLTNGDRGSNDRSQDRAELAATRLAETEAAAEVLG